MVYSEIIIKTIAVMLSQSPLHILSKELTIQSYHRISNGSTQHVIILDLDLVFYLNINSQQE